MSDKTERFIDMVDRDPRNINQFVRVDFDEIFGEVDAPRSVDCIWVTSFRCFVCSRNLGYKLLTYPFSLLLALMWGCLFGTISFSSIWICTPTLRLLTIISKPIKTVLITSLQVFFGPFIEAFAMYFSRIHLVNSKSDPPKRLDIL